MKSKQSVKFCGLKEWECWINDNHLLVSLHLNVLPFW